ncbi:MAG TPA: tetratricopeptide repeat protein [Stellaceae bacterium]|nr:tetratricopeptide repeat protein [Stellaceae bacterium]
MGKMASGLARTGAVLAVLFPLVAAGGAGAAATGASAVTPFGAYLAGLHAQRERDYRAAAQWFEQALEADPTAPELIGRTFLMEISEGGFARAETLAKSELHLNPDNTAADLVLLIERIKAGDAKAALAEAEALPADGLHRFVAPLALAWTRMAAGDLPGADAALQRLDKFAGLAPLKFFQLGLLYDFDGRPNKAETNFKEALAATGRLNWRLAEAMANFYQRRGQPAEAKKVYQRFVAENPGSELAEAVPDENPAAPPPPLVASASDGLAEALFDLASVVNEPETIDLALLYDRFALALRPHLTLAQLLLSDILSAERQPQKSLSVLAQIPSSSSYYWSAQLRVAANLDTLGRTDEAIALLEKLSMQYPKRAGAAMQLGDLLRENKRFPEAVKAYDEAITRLSAEGLPERWSLYYSRGIALERSGQWKQAEADLLHALKLKPDEPLVLNYLGYTWIDRGQNLQQALKMIEKAVSLRPEDGYIVDSLGWAHYRLGQYKEAIHYLEKAIELVPEDPTINDHLGDAYWQVGREIEARYQWRRALQFGPEKKEIKPLEAKIARGLAPVVKAGGG